ncbi:MAG: fumarylacetoacetate hydrolase family protein [Rhodobacteraceae bacterium]|nr:fumarylacetoacetate hydrolase family protein [Paracoccaceae bacterium]
MRLASFETARGASFGLVEGEALRDLGALPGRPWADLRACIGAGGLAEAAARAAEAPLVALSDVRFLPVIPNPARILCVGINYASHIAETGRETPEKPMLFVRFPSSQVGHGQPMLRPAESERFDFEGELAVIVGHGGRRIPQSEALAAVAGYACYNDGSIRDWQRHSSQFTAGKNFPATGAFGPWMTTTDDIPDPAALNLITRLNGAVVQEAPISDLVFDVPALIAYCSTFTPLEPGDVIITGTTGGVGAFRTPPLWMKSGDVVEVEIDGIGTLSNPVADEG